MSKLYPLYKRYLEILEFVISRSDCIFIDLFIYLLCLFICLFIVRNGWSIFLNLVR